MEEISRSNKPIDRSDIIALFALILSLGAFIVSIYEASILKKEQGIMLTQQKASVWPYLETDWSYSYGMEKVEIECTITNKGVGPARVNKMDLYVGDEYIESYEALVENSFIESIMEDTISSGSVSITYGLTSNSVMAANEIREVFNLEFDRFEGDMEHFRKLKFRIETCYCSIFDDCWTLTERQITEIEGGCVSTTKN